MTILDAIKTRYAAKRFDPTKQIPADIVQSLKELLQLSPSSVNSQPWHFIFASTQDGKDRIASVAAEYNQSKIKNASHVVVFCSKTVVDDAFIDHLLDQEDKDGRFASADDRTAQLGVKKHFIDLHRTDFADVPAWAAKQLYLNVGTFLLGVSALGLDAVPIEGFDGNALNAEFDLDTKNLASAVIVAVGYKDDDDFNAKLPKSRLPLEEILTEI